MAIKISETGSRVEQKISGIDVFDLRISETDFSGMGLAVDKWFHGLNR